MEATVLLKTGDDLSMAYILRAARTCRAIAKGHSLARKLTIKRNTGARRTRILMALLTFDEPVGVTAEGR